MQVIDIRVYINSVQRTLGTRSPTRQDRDVCDQGAARKHRAPSRVSEIQILLAEKPLSLSDTSRHSASALRL